MIPWPSSGVLDTFAVSPLSSKLGLVVLGVHTRKILQRSRSAIGDVCDRYQSRIEPDRPQAGSDKIENERRTWQQEFLCVPRSIVAPGEGNLTACLDFA